MFCKALESVLVCSQTQLCQLRCLMTILDNYMFRPLLAIFRLSLRELKVLFDYIPFPVLTHTHNGDDTLPKFTPYDYSRCKFNCQIRKRLD